MMNDGDSWRYNDIMSPINIDSRNALMFYIEKVFTTSTVGTRKTHLYSVKLNGTEKKRILSLTDCRSYAGPISDRKV